MIEIRNLSKSFGEVEALRDVSFSVPDGSITGLLGKNGAGKTTTLAAVCGLIRPDGGGTCVGGIERPSVERRKLLGAVLQQAGLYERLTASENVAFFGRLYGLREPALGARVKELTSELAFEAIANRRAAGLSTGERMKVALARALVHNPRHLVLDEPTNGLDIPSVINLRATLQRLKANGTCIVLSSHALGEVHAVCDRIVVIAAGRVVAEGSADDVCVAAGSRTLEAAFVKLTDRLGGR